MKNNTLPGEKNHRRALENRMLSPVHPMDLPFLCLVLALVSMGLIVLFSASYAVGNYRRGDPYT